MADNEALASAEPQIEEGQLAPSDYSPAQKYTKADLTETEITTLTGLVEKTAKRDLAARRFEVEQAWEARLFSRGYQYLLRGRNGGFYLPQSSQNGNARQGAYNLKPTNIYSANEQIIVSALTRQVPKVRFQPDDPQSDGDITAAEEADEFKKVFARNNDLPEIHTDLAHLCWTDGRVGTYVRYVKDAQRWGHEDNEEPVVPEDEGQSIDNSAGGEGAAGSAGADLLGADSGNAVAEGEPSSEQRDSDTGEQEGEGSLPQQATKKPKGREVIDVYGKLEVKVPINTKNLSECDFLKFAKEYDLSVAKAMEPAIEKSITASGGPGENELDRISRINCALALSGAYGVAYVTGDAYDTFVTRDMTWLRPSNFMAVDDKAIRDKFIGMFPEGCLVVHMGKTFAWVRAECVDDHWTLMYASRGDGQNRAALGAWMIPIQKRVNDLVDLIYMFFVNTVPRKWYDSESFNINAIKEQGNIPGNSGPFTPKPGISNDQLILVEQTQQHQPELPEFIKYAINELSQLLSGAYPALAGGDTEGNDTASGIQTQRDQAMSRLGLVWHAIQAATANYHRQAVMCAARCRESDVKETVPGEDSEVILELNDLKGNVLCFPESDSGFPESWSERQARFTAILQDSKNPFVQQLLSLPKNMKLAKDAIGLTDFDIPQSDSVDKQLGEIEILMKSGPMPNPKVVEAMQQAAEMAKGGAPPEAMQQVMQLIQGVPPQVSSYPIEPGVDDDAVHADTCKEFLNSPKGRKMKNGSPEDQAAYANIVLHMKEHQANVQAPPPQNKPVNEQISFKDLPPDGQAQMAAQAGIKLDPNALAAKAQQDDAQEHEQAMAKAKSNGSGLNIQ